MVCLSVQDLRFLDYGPMELSLDPGQILGVSGASGSGKSLLLKAISDLIESNGTVIVSDQNRWELAPALWRSQVMLVPAEPQWWHETVGEHMPEAANPVWRELGFDDEVLSKPVVELSSGEKQRLGLVRALCREPDILLLDEPTANLDPENTSKVEACIQNYLKSGNRAAVWVSHDSSQLERVATRTRTITNKRFEEEGRA